MILRPKTLEELSSQLTRLPEEKRRVIITVGRHPNEGTIRIAQRHHLEWQEHGAVVIQLPKEWTPHYFWRQMDKTIISKIKPTRLGIRGKTASLLMRTKTKQKIAHETLAHVEKQANEIPSDSFIANHLYDVGFRVPVLSFHAGGQIVSPHRMKNYVDLTPGSAVALADDIRFSKNAHYEPAKNELVIEYGSHATYPKSEKTKQLVNRINWLFNNRNLLVDRPSFGQISEDYLQLYGSMSKQGLTEFTRDHSQEFNKLLLHLAKYGLKK